MKKFIVAIFLAATMAEAQTTVNVINVPNPDPGGTVGVVPITIPVPDGTTITSKNNVWSCVQGAAALPSSPTFDVITANKLVLNPSQTYINGAYFWTSLNGSFSPTPMPSWWPNPPTPSTPPPPTAYQITMPALAVGGSTLITANAKVTSTQQLTAYAVRTATTGPNLICIAQPVGTALYVFGLNPGPSAVPSGQVCRVVVSGQ